MKTLLLTQDNPQMGTIDLTMRFIRDVIYIKTNNNQYSNAMLEDLSKKGAVIIRGRGWLQVRLFGKDLEEVKLGNNEFNLKTDSDEKIEESIRNFYAEKYIQAGFKLQ
jgi:hypothetical protein